MKGLAVNPRKIKKNGEESSDFSISGESDQNYCLGESSCEIGRKY